MDHAINNAESKDDPIEGVCAAVNSGKVGNAFWSINGVITPIIADKCAEKAKAFCDPDSNTLTTDRLIQTVDSSQANSQVLVITNSAPNDVSIDKVIRMAIARRIKAISQIVDFYVKGVEVISVQAAKGPTTTLKYNVGKSEFYIAYRSVVENEKLTFTTPDNLELISDTGLWKLLRGQPIDEEATVSYECNGCDKDFNVYLMSSAALRTFVAVSSDESAIDASAPYAVTGPSQTIVARIMSNDQPVTKDMTTELSSEIPFEANLLERPMCQFSVALGTVKCTKTTPAILSVKTKDLRGSAVPFLCLDEKDLQAPDEFEFRDKDLPEEDFDEEVSRLVSSPLIKQVPLKRTFAIVARNVKDKQTEKSTVDNLFVLPNNVFDYLVSYMKQNDGYYTTWLSNLFGTENPRKALQLRNFTSFITHVMNSVHEAKQNDNEELFDYTAALEDALYPKNTYSDIFVIIDSETDGKLESTKILERISSARARLFFIMVETYTNFDDTTYQLVNQLAAKSGGAALRATDYVSVQKFFEQYFSIILDGDLVSYQEFFPQEQNLETQSFYVNSGANYTALITASGKASLGNLACKSSPASPHLANEVGTLILVVERSKDPLKFDEKTIRSLQGVQIIVIYYGGGSDPKLVLSTTDPRLLTSLEPFGEFDGSAAPADPFGAISLGLRSQLTSRSVVALLSRGGEHHITKDFVNLLSAHRAELRVFSEQNSANLSILATLGNGMPFYCTQKEFSELWGPESRAGKLAQAVPRKVVATV
ncbi:hypothetical protein Aduo_019260 [Ancylostoma duodenale]